MLSSWSEDEKSKESELEPSESPKHELGRYANGHLQELQLLSWRSFQIQELFDVRLALVSFPGRV
jgi:hypothetical protein